jgi:hypothetical protein
MLNPTTIRFEASDAQPMLLENAALIVLETAEGRVALQMPREVFVSLFRQMQVALEQPVGPSVPPKAV